MLELTLLITANLFGAASPDVSPPLIAHRPCRSFQLRQPLRIEAEIVDDSTVFAPRLVYRRASSAQWQEVDLKRLERPNVYGAEIPAADTIERLYYYLEAYDELGNGPATSGTSSEPHMTSGVETGAECSSDPSLFPDAAQLAKGNQGIGGPGVDAAEDTGCNSVVCSPWLWVPVGLVVLGGIAAGVTFALLPPDKPSEVTLNIAAQTALQGQR